MLIKSPHNQDMVRWFLRKSLADTLICHSTLEKNVFQMFADCIDCIADCME